MAISKIKKQKIISEYINELQNNNSFFFIDTRGVDIKSINTLKNNLQKINLNTKNKLLKNTLFKIALTQSGKESLISQIEGYNAVVITNDQQNLVAQEIVKFSEETQSKLKFAILNDNIYSIEDIKDLSTINSREALMFSLITDLNGNLTKLCLLLKMEIINLINVIKNLEEKKYQEVKS
jgi:ribosomal protein L10